MTSTSSRWTGWTASTWRLCSGIAGTPGCRHRASSPTSPTRPRHSSICTRVWLDEDREGLRLQQRLSDAARQRDAGGREASDLYRGTRLERKLLEGHTANVFDLAFAGDGALVTASADLTVRFWDLDTALPLGRPLALSEHTAVGSFGRRFAHTLQPTDVGILIPTPGGVLAADLRPSTLVDRVCNRTGENLSDIAFAQYLPGEEYRLTCPRFGSPQPVLAEP